MMIYYFILEAIPCHSNPESNEFGGAYINCWVKAPTQKEALEKAKEYIKGENWMFIKVEDAWEAQRQAYVDLPDSLECYDDACKNGMSAIFNTWPIDENHTN